MSEEIISFDTSTAVNHVERLSSALDKLGREMSQLASASSGVKGASNNLDGLQKSANSLGNSFSQLKTTSLRQFRQQVAGELAAIKTSVAGAGTTLPTSLAKVAGDIQTAFDNIDKIDSSKGKKPGNYTKQQLQGLVADLQTVQGKVGAAAKGIKAELNVLQQALSVQLNSTNLINFAGATPDTLRKSMALAKTILAEDGRSLQDVLGLQHAKMLDTAIQGGDKAIEKYRRQMQRMAQLMQSVEGDPTKWETRAKGLARNVGLAGVISAIVDPQQLQVLETYSRHLQQVAVRAKAAREASEQVKAATVSALRSDVPFSPISTTPAGKEMIQELKAGRELQAAAAKEKLALQRQETASILAMQKGASDVTLKMISADMSANDKAAKQNEQHAKNRVNSLASVTAKNNEFSASVNKAITGNTSTYEKFNAKIKDIKDSIAATSAGAERFAMVTKMVDKYGSKAVDYAIKDKTYVADQRQAYTASRVVPVDNSKQVADNLVNLAAKNTAFGETVRKAVDGNTSAMGRFNSQIQTIKTSLAQASTEAERLAISQRLTERYGTRAMTYASRGYNYVQEMHDQRANFVGPRIPEGYVRPQPVQQGFWASLMQGFNPGQIDSATGRVRNFHSVLRAFAGDTRDVHAAARGLAAGFDAMWLTWGNMVPLLAFTALSMGFRAVVQSGAEVHHTLMTIRNLALDTSLSYDQLNQQTAMLNARMHEFVGLSPAGPKELAETMKTLALAGLNVESVYEALPSVINMALVGDTTTKEAADALTTIGVAFRMSAAEYGHINDVIAKTAAESKSSVESINNAFKLASVANQQYGASLEDVATGLGLLANSGIQGSSAGTALRNMYSDLTGRTPKVAAALKALGVDAVSAEGKIDDLGKVFSQLIIGMDQYAAKSKPKILQDIFSERGGKEAVAIIAGINTEFQKMAVEAAKSGKVIERNAATLETAYDRVKSKMTEAEGFSIIKAAEQSVTPLSQMKSAISAFEGLIVNSFTAVQPYISQVARELNSLFKSQGAVETLGGMAAGLISIISIFMEWGKQVAIVVGAVGSLYLGLQFLAGGALAIGAVTKAIQTATGEMGTFGAVMTAITNANPWLILIKGILAVGAGIIAYKTLTFDANKASADFGTGGLKDVNDALAKELDRLNKVNEAREKGISLMELESRTAGAKAVDDIDRQVATLGQQRSAKYQEIQGLVEPDGSVSRVNLLNYRRLQVEYAGLQGQVGDLVLAKQKELDRGASLRSQIVAANKKSSDAIAARKQGDEDTFRSLMGGTGTKAWTGSSDGARRGRTPKESMSLKPYTAEAFRYVEKRYEQQITTAQQASDLELHILESKHKAGLLLESTYMVQRAALVEKSEDTVVALQKDKLADLRKTYEDRFEVERKYLAEGIAKTKEGSDEREKVVQNYVNNMTKILEQFGSANEVVEQKLIQSDIAKQKRIADITSSIAAQTKELLKNNQEWLRSTEEGINKEHSGYLAKEAVRSQGPEAMARFEAEAKVMSEAESQINRLTKAQEAMQAQADAAFDAVANGATDLATMTVWKESQNQADRLSKEIVSVTEAAENLSKKAGQNAVARFNLDRERKQQDKLADDYLKMVDDIGNSLFDSLLNGGESALDQLKQYARQAFLQPIKVMLQPILGSIGSAVASILMPSGANAAGLGYGTGTSQLLGAAGSGLQTANMFGLGEGITSTLSSWGTQFTAGLQSTLGLAGTASQYAATYGLTATGAGSQAAMLASQTAGMGAGAGASGGFMSTLGAAAPWIAGGLVLLNALGVFRKTKQVDTALGGTVGAGGQVNDIALMRKSGTLLSGPKYWTEDKGVSSANRVIQDAFKALTSSTIDMAKGLGLATDHVKNFTTTLGTELIHPDTQLKGIKTTDLDKDLADKKITAAQHQAAVQERIMKALEEGNNELAEQIIGSWETVSTSVTKSVARTVGAGDSLETIYEDITETTTELVYKQSEYAKVGEKAIDTLRRLSTSLTSANNSLIRMGKNPLQKGLAEADVASKFMDEFGGAENYNSVFEEYFKATFTPMQQFSGNMALLTTQFKDLGFAVPTSTAELRAMVEAQDLNTEAGRKTAASLMKLAPTLQSTGDSFLSMIGLSTQGLASTLVEGMRVGADPAAAGRSVGEQITHGIQASVAQGFAEQIMTTVTTGIVMPIVTAMLAGQTVTQALSSAAIQKARDQIQAISKLFGDLANSPEWLQFINDLPAALAPLFNNLPKNFLPAAPTPYTAPKEDTSSTADKTPEKSKGQELIDRLKESNASDAVELTRLKYGDAAAATAELNEALSVMTESEKQAYRVLWDISVFQKAEIKRLNERKDLDRSFDEAMRARAEVEGDLDTASRITNKIREEELAKLEPANRGIQARIWMLQDETEVLTERKGVENNLLAAMKAKAEAEGDFSEVAKLTNQIRAEELKKLDPSNRALQQRVWALEDETEVLNQRKGIEGSLSEAMRARAELDEDEVALANLIADARKAELLTIAPANRDLQQRVWLLEDETTALRKQREAQEAFISAMDNSADRLMSPEASESYKLGRVSEKLSKAFPGSELVSVAALQNLTIQQVKDAALSLAKDATISLQARTALLEAASQLIELKINAVNAAFDKLSESVEAEKKRITKARDASIKSLQDKITANDKLTETANKSLEAINKVFDGLSSNIETLRGVAKTIPQSLAASKAFIDMALSVYKAGGSVDSGQLLKHSQALTSDDKKYYKSDAEYRYAQALSANKLDGIKGIVGVQKTTAEKQLEAAKKGNELLQEQIKQIEEKSQREIDQLTEWLDETKRQTDIALGIKTEVQDLATATDNYNKTIQQLLGFVVQGFQAYSAAASGGFVAGGGGGFDSGVVAAAKKPSVGGSAASVAVSGGGRFVGNGGTRTMDEIITEDWMRNRGLDTTPEGIAKFKSELTFGRRVDANGLEFVTITDLSGNVYGNLDYQTVDETWIEQQRRALQWADDAGLPDAYSQVFAPRDDLINEARNILENQGAQALYDAVKSTGATLEEANALLGLPEGTLQSEVDKMGLPQFATGKGRVPSDMIAMLHKGERVVPNAQVNDFDAKQSKDREKAQNDRLESVVGDLTRVMTVQKDKIVSLERMFDSLTQGGKRMLTTT